MVFGPRLNLDKKLGNVDFLSVCLPVSSQAINQVTLNLTRYRSEFKVTWSIPQICPFIIKGSPFELHTLKLCILGEVPGGVRLMSRNDEVEVRTENWGWLTSFLFIALNFDVWGLWGTVAALFVAILFFLGFAPVFVHASSCQRCWREFVSLNSFLIVSFHPSHFILAAFPLYYVTVTFATL